MTKPGPGDLDPLDVGRRVRARGASTSSPASSRGFAAGRLGGGHGDVGRPVAVLAPAGRSRWISAGGSMPDVDEGRARGRWRGRRGSRGSLRYRERSAFSARPGRAARSRCRSSHRDRPRRRAPWGRASAHVTQAPGSLGRRFSLVGAPRDRRLRSSTHARSTALVAQRIEHRPPEPCAQVRVLPRALVLQVSMQVSGPRNAPRF